jgi:hypothetical protein
MLYKEKVLHKQYLQKKFIPYRYKSRPCTTTLVLLRMIPHQHIHPIHCYFCYSLNRPSFCHFHSCIRLFLCRYHNCSSLISLLVNWCWENRQGQTLHNRPYGTVGQHTFISLTIYLMTKHISLTISSTQSRPVRQLLHRTKSIAKTTQYRGVGSNYCQQLVLQGKRNIFLYKYTEDHRHKTE